MAVWSDGNRADQFKEQTVERNGGIEGASSVNGSGQFRERFGLLY